VSAADPLAGYRFRYPMEVRFRDLDTLGHVNNAVYLTYLESARIAWWMHVTARDGLSGLNMILARVEVDFRAPVEFGARLEIGVRCASVRRSSFVVESAIVDSGRGRIAAEARKVLVHYDYAANRSSLLPEELRQKLLAQDPDLLIEV
jgi:acyl-CoA thioester hydrolase